jgi:diaminopimelate decarboxylase/aspartate kinase
VKPWVVLKFGGTSVSTAATWAQIARRTRELLPDRRVWIVASALSGVSDRLERALEEARTGVAGEARDWIHDRHRALSDALALDAPARGPWTTLLADLDRLLDGVRLTGEASPRLKARVMALGELASTRLGTAALAAQGIRAHWVDARDLLVSRASPRDPEVRRYLDADVEPEPAPERAEAAAAGESVVLTQGFIAATARGETCLLGRGGSDTSGALFAVLVGAASLEIWTDVHGLFSTDPHHTPAARLLRRTGYREAQELAAMGAKVLHPRCLGPVARFDIPLTIRNTFDPDAPGTAIVAPREEEDEAPAVMAVTRRAGVTLLTLSTLEMWGSAGFLARVFAPFDELAISVDLVATSQSAVSLTLDRIPGGVEGEPFAALLQRLRALGRVEVVHPCAVVSIVGRRIRTVLHELGPAFAAFQEHAVHLVSESSEDLNLSFVVDEEDAAPLVAQLHERLIPAQGAESRFGPTWEMLQARAGRAPAPVLRDTWWRHRRDELLALVGDGRPRYVYDLATVAARASDLQEQLPSVGQLFYALKANRFPAILQLLADQGFGLECVSAGEVALAREAAGPAVPLLFTPNFCPLEEYGLALESGAEVTVDGPHVLRDAPDLFRGIEVILRVDPGWGLGHGEKVRTAGPQQKFGHPLDRCEAFAGEAAKLGMRVTGLHAHLGSGIFEASAWSEVAQALAGLRALFPALRTLNVGGGLGVVERPGQTPLDLHVLDAGLAAVAEELPGLTLRLEPGRYLVSEAGVLVAPVTQVREKGGIRFVGLAAGMNSLIRPAFYGAWHGIHHLTRLGQPPAGYAHVVGPICESADVLGRDRLLPECVPGDVLLIENAGAYGAVMGSTYNARAVAEEVALPRSTFRVAPDTGVASSASASIQRSRGPGTLP